MRARNPIIFFYCIFQFAFIYSSAQNSQRKIDSLQSLITNAKDTVLVDVYLNIGREYLNSFGQADSLLVFAKRALIVAEKINNSKGSLKCYINIGTAYARNSDFENCFVYWNKAVTVANRIMDFKSLAELHNKFGTVYENLENFDEAIKHYLLAADFYNKVSDYAGLGYSYIGIASVYVTQNQPNKRLTYTRKAVAVVEKIPEESAFTKALVYYYCSIHFMELRTLNKTYIDSSFALSVKGLKLCKEKGFKDRVPGFLNLLSEYYYLNRNFELCRAYSDSIFSDRNLVNHNLAVTVYCRLGEYYDHFKDYTKALACLDSAKKHNVGKAAFHDKLIFKKQYEIYKKLGKYQEALSSFEIWKAAEDTLLSTEKNEIVNRLEQKFNKAQNEKTIVELNQEKEILNQQEEISQLKINALIIGVLFLALLVFAIVFFYRQSVLKSKFKTLEIEQRLNRARINPHFFFNALASLQALSMEERKSKEISEYIHRFSKIMRESLESTFNELNTIENEIEFLTHYLELQKLRSDNKFTYHFNVDANIETDSLMIPGMILQPFIENSIEHGFSSIETGGKIEIIFSLENEQLKVKVIDNGSGFKDSDKHKSYPSRATQIIRDRLYLLNKQCKTNAIFELVNLPDNKGTRVEIQLPIIPKT